MCFEPMICRAMNRFTVNTRYRHTRFRPNHVTGTHYRCQIIFVIGTSTPSHRHTKKPCVPITNYGVKGSWGRIIVPNGSFRPFPAHSTFSFKHGVAPLPRRGNVHRDSAFEVVVRISSHSPVKCLGLDRLGPHLYLELDKRLEFSCLTQRRREFVGYKSSIHSGPMKRLD